MELEGLALGPQVRKLVGLEEKDLIWEKRLERRTWVRHALSYTDRSESKAVSGPQNSAGPMPRPQGQCPGPAGSGVPVPLSKAFSWDSPHERTGQVGGPQLGKALGLRTQPPSRTPQG